MGVLPLSQAASCASWTSVSPMALGGGQRARLTLVNDQPIVLQVRGRGTRPLIGGLIALGVVGSIAAAARVVWGGLTILAAAH